MQMFLASLLATAAVAAPTTQPATNVTATGATLNGTVDGPRRWSTSSGAPRTGRTANTHAQQTVSGGRGLGDVSRR